MSKSELKIVVMNTEPCPLCGSEHPVGEDVDKRIYCGCGMILDMVMPWMKMSATGYVWKIVGATQAVKPRQ